MSPEGNIIIIRRHFVNWHGVKALQPKLLGLAQCYEDVNSKTAARNKYLESLIKG